MAERAQPPTISAATTSGRCVGSVTASESYGQFVAKCVEQLATIDRLLSQIRSAKRYPFSGFYQLHWSQIAQSNVRAVDTLRSIHGQLERLQEQTVRDMIAANQRFQTALVTILLTRFTLTAMLDRFHRSVREYEQLVGSAWSSSSSSSVSTSESAVSTTTTSTRDPRETQAARSKLQEINGHVREAKRMLDQTPMCAAPIRMELELLALYDMHDDSETVHAVLTSRWISNRPECRARRLYATWDEVTSDESVRGRLENAATILGRANRTRQGELAAEAAAAVDQRNRRTAEDAPSSVVSIPPPPTPPPPMSVPSAIRVLPDIHPIPTPPPRQQRRPDTGR